jgi:hypothetical protein
MQSYIFGNAKKYTFELSSDGGTYFCSVYARNWKTAIKLVCDWQLCPESAIINKWIDRS